MWVGNWLRVSQVRSLSSILRSHLQLAKNDWAFSGLASTCDRLRSGTIARFTSPPQGAILKIFKIVRALEYRLQPAALARTAG